MLLTENHMVGIPIAEFFGFDHDKYLDIFMEMGEEREPLIDLIANAIVQHVIPHDEFCEMIRMQLGYMGCCPIESAGFYEMAIDYVRSVSIKCRRYIPTDLVTIGLVYAVEESELVNIVFSVDRSVDNASYSRY